MSDEIEKPSVSSSGEVTLRDVEWVADPDFTGSEFTNTMQNPQAQIHVERFDWMGPWQITVSDSDGFLWDGRIWPGSRDKSLNEAVEKAVKIARVSAGQRGS
jgi:hypothetical protein